MLQNSKQSKGIKKASSFIFLILRILFTPGMFLLYRFRFDKKTSKGIKRPCLILSNHQTIVDQFVVTLGFRFGINWVASDSIFRHGFLSRMMVALTRPIPFSKGSSDLIAIKTMIALAKSGGAIGLFPSGNRSFFGDECTIVPGIGKLAKKLGVPLVLVQLRGGFNTLARWKFRPSLGKFGAIVTKVVSAAELAAMSNTEADEIIRHELYFNEFAYNKTAQIVYKGLHRAEYLESVLFYCPVCASLTGLHSQGNRFFCSDCGAEAEVTGFGTFKKINNAGTIPETILEWSHKQLDYLKHFDYSDYTDKPLFSDANVTLSRAERAKKEELLGTGAIELFNDKLVVCGREFLLAETTTAVHGVRKMTIYYRDGIYAVMAPVRVNLVKYMICGFHLRKEEFYGY